MKIGHPANKPPATPAAGTPAGGHRRREVDVDPQARRDGSSGRRCERHGRALSSTASTLLSGGSSPDFDAAKVAQISGAISNGSFKVDHARDRRQADLERAGAPRQGAELMAPAETAAGQSPDLEARLANVEVRLAALGNALRARDPADIDLHASELHRALAIAVSHFSDAAKTGPLPAALRSRLATASGQVAGAARVARPRHRGARPRHRRAAAARQHGASTPVVGSADRGMFKSGVIRVLNPIAVHGADDHAAQSDIG